MWEVLIMQGAIISKKTGQDFAGYPLLFMAPRDGLDNSDGIRIGRALARPKGAGQGRPVSTPKAVRARVC
jgi:hypothetical protein